MFTKFDELAQRLAGINVSAPSDDEHNDVVDKIIAHLKLAN
jgi:hypothetical protein